MHQREASERPFAGELTFSLCARPTKTARTWGPQDAQKYLTTHALSQFSLPGEPGFPLNQVFVGANPGDRLAAAALRSYLTQARQETVLRLVERYVYSPTDPSTEGGKKASKWWMAFSVRSLSLSQPRLQSAAQEIADFFDPCHECLQRRAFMGKKL